ncbi:trypsin-like serine peptidase [Streptomyces hesseae]|uniref:Trypsin-like peptidase domain-containing protein n=1 Tax=Streptomyces hesseae TaxID=3075519 RepID=A0ABU2STY0_9ACTN|nr:trypsin-like peptidase domain-containing protein [Streptomyces sp. DSM 40473]MDT0451379.1 trypsin-like peptidase domain-containing protein [Streptomyces sp. DSM 40473]
MRPTHAALVTAAALALVALGLFVATSGPAADAPLATGDATGHYRQSKAAADEAAKALKDVVRVARQAAPAPLNAPPQAGPAEAAPESPAQPPSAAEAGPSSAVGPLFYTAESEPAHGCTASVVHSPAGDLVVTAAHCVYMDGFRTDLAFVPGYKDGTAPYGVWVPTSIDVDPEWAADRDPDHDVAFLRVRPAEGGSPVERVTGAERVRFDPPRERLTQVLGYPNDDERPVSCRNSTEGEGDTQLRFDCEGLPNGTSGSPFLTDVDPGTGLGTLVGVLGGKDEGGDEETSYASYFGPAVKRLYERATRA